MIFRKSYKVTVLSPVHISGFDKWIEGINYERKASSTQIFDLESIHLNEPENGEFSGTELDNPIEKLKGSTAVYELPYKIFTNEISRFAKNVWGNPYIPGNSLKGFFNSSLLFSKNINISGLDPELPDFHNILDSLEYIIFEDIEFPVKSLNISDIKILNLTSYKSYGWKKFGPESRSIPTPLTATSQYVETLKEGEIIITDIKLKPSKDNQFDENALFSHSETIMNDFTRKIVQNELEFYNRTNMQEGYQFYWSLSEKMKKAVPGFYVCIGWGIGWNSLLGNLHTDKSINSIRRNYDIGKTDRPCPGCKKPLKVDKFNKDRLFCYSCKKSYPFDSVITQLFPVFPKTRKFVVEGNNPILPLGWLRFEPTQNLEKTIDRQTHNIEIKVRQKTTKIIKPEKMLTPEGYPELKAQTAHFKKKIKIQNRGNFPTEFNMFLNKVAQLEFIISISGTDIDPNLDTIQLITTEKIEEIIFHFSHEGKGIVLNIKTGAKDESQRNFVINRIWEIIQPFIEKK